MVRIESHNRFFYRLQYRTRSTSGNWNSTELVHSGYGLGNGYEPFGNVIFTEDATRTVHFFWAQPDASAILHAAKSPGSPWDTSVLVHAFDGDSTIGGFFLSTDPTGTIHILGQRANQLSPIYWQQQPGQSWQEKQFVNGVIAGEHQQWFSGMIATNSNPILIFRQLSEPAIRLIELNASSQIGSSTISQQVEIPSSIHKPTLAFMYQTLGNSDNGATFSVLVSEAITRSSAISGTSGLTETSGLSGTLAISTSQVYTDNQIHSWKLGWVDMDTWKGKSVTITFEINQPVSGDSFQANLDDISLGSWETPVVTQSLPYHIEFGTSTTLTIHGDNFINSPVVHVGTVPVNSRWVDEHTLEATLPANLPAAIYDIWVKNPGESEGVLGGGLAIGKQVYLPLIAR